MQEEKKHSRACLLSSPYSSLQHIIIVSVNAHHCSPPHQSAQAQQTNIILALLMLQIKTNRATPWEYL